MARCAEVTRAKGDSPGCIDPGAGLKFGQKASGGVEDCDAAQAGAVFFIGIARLTPRIRNNDVAAYVRMPKADQFTASGRFGLRNAAVELSGTGWNRLPNISTLPVLKLVA